MTACLFWNSICAYVPLCVHPAWRQRRCKAQTPMMHLFSLFCHVGAACVFVWLPRPSRLVASEARSRSLCLPLLQTSLALSFLFNSHWLLLFICFAPHSVAHWLQLSSLRWNRPLLMHFFATFALIFHMTSSSCLQSVFSSSVPLFGLLPVPRSSPLPSVQTTPFPLLIFTKLQTTFAILTQTVEAAPCLFNQALCFLTCFLKPPFSSTCFFFLRI